MLVRRVLAGGKGLSDLLRGGEQSIGHHGSHRVEGEALKGGSGQYHEPSQKVVFFFGVMQAVLKVMEEGMGLCLTGHVQVSNEVSKRGLERVDYGVYHRHARLT